MPNSIVNFLKTSGISVQLSKSINYKYGTGVAENAKLTQMK